MSIYDEGATYYYTAAGTNTPTEVSDSPVTLFSIGVSNVGGASGYLQLYDNGTATIAAGTTIGTPQLVIPVPANVSTTSGTVQYRVRDWGDHGIKFNGGLTLLWANGVTGTAAVSGNAIVDIAYKGTA